MLFPQKASATSYANLDLQICADAKSRCVEIVVGQCPEFWGKFCAGRYIHPARLPPKKSNTEAHKSPSGKVQQSL